MFYVPCQCRIALTGRHAWTGRGTGPDIPRFANPLTLQNLRHVYNVTVIGASCAEELTPVVEQFDTHTDSFSTLGVVFCHGNGPLRGGKVVFSGHRGNLLHKLFVVEGQQERVAAVVGQGVD